MRRQTNPKELRDLSIHAERTGGRHRLLLRGELDLTSAPKLTDAVARACADGATEVTLDVSKLEFMTPRAYARSSTAELSVRRHPASSA